MIKNKEFIDSLSFEQKLKLLTSGSFESGTLLTKSVPTLVMANLTDMNNSDDNETEFPSFKSLANSWDCELIGNIAGKISSRAAKTNINLLVTPQINVQTSGYSSGLTEDPFLSSKFAAALVKGISSTGVTPILSDCAVNESDAEYMDKEINESVVSDFVIQPFVSAIMEVGSGTVMTSYKRLFNNYRDVNTKNVNDSLHNSYQIVKTICGDTSDGLTLSALEAGNIFVLGGNAKQLEEAHNEYLRLKKLLESGKITMEDVKVACSNGKALSDEVIDRFLDRYFDFAIECSARFESVEQRNNGTDSTTLMAKAAEESIVLLKNTNNKALPLKEGIKLALIGHAAVLSPHEGSDSLEAHIKKMRDSLPFEYMGYARGYDVNGENNEVLMQEAHYLVMSSDTVLVFIDFDRITVSDSKKMKMPDSYISLFNSLNNTRRNIIAVISSERAFDADFEKYCDAIILMPRGNSVSYDALVKVLIGAINPSGKLAYSFFDNPDQMHSEMKIRKEMDQIKIGQFFGYRGYDTAGTLAKYPFGHGLSYTKFKYSGLKVNDCDIEFTLKNAEKIAGCETVQVYVGKIDSKILRPLKELKSFRRVYLAGGESTVVRISLNYDDLKVYYFENGERRVEGGDYMVYVGSSVSNIRLKKNIFISGDRFLWGKENISGYLYTMSNILSGGYTLKDKIVGFFKRRFGRHEDNENNETVLPDQPELENLFFDEFVVPKNAVAIQPSAAFTPTKDASVIKMDFIPSLEYVEYSNVYSNIQEQKQFDPTLTMKVAAVELVHYMRENGIELDIMSARSVLSAMATSRLIILKENESKLSRDFLCLLSHYFGTSEYIEELNEADKDVDKLFYSFGIMLQNSQSQIKKATEAAAINRNSIHIGAVQMSYPFANWELLRPLVSFAIGKGKEFISYARSINATIKIPSNIWFIVTIENEHIKNVPQSLMEHAVVIAPKILKIDGVAENNETHRLLGFNQFIKLAGESAKKHLLAENMWKKIDAIEDYVKAYTPYFIGNKQLRKIEAYSSAYIDCGGTDAEALGSVVAAKLIPSIEPILEASKPDEDGDLSLTLEKILGEDCVSVLF